jgi:hypothetical protein
LENPKSASLTFVSESSDVNSRFSGLRSRWASRLHQQSM